MRNKEIKKLKADWKRKQKWWKREGDRLIAERLKNGCKVVYVK